MPDTANPTPWTPAQTRAQFSAIALLRWRMAVNARRRKGGTGELIGRIVLAIIFAAFALSMMATAGFAAYAAAHLNHLQRLDLILWGVFGLCQLLNIQLGQPGTTFDPTQLIRFPMHIRIYVFIRLFFGLLSPANILGALLSLSIAVGLTVAIPSLWLFAFASLTIFAITNALFSRMVFAWVDRWLSTRRAREIFTGIIFAVSLGIQWANVTFNPAYGNRHHNAITLQRYNAAVHFFHHSQTYLAPLTPGLITNALTHANHNQPTAFVTYTLGCCLFAFAFFAIFAWRMATEFRGENFSDAANAVSSKSTTRTIATSASLAPAPATSQSAFSLPPALGAVLAKELLQIRRNTGLFYGLIAPIVFVFLFAGRIAANGSLNSTLIFPAAVAYSLMGTAALSYNSFGLEGAGVQFYFMAPTPLQQVFLAKNLMNFFLAAVEVAAVYVIICTISVHPTASSTALGILWATATLLLSTTLGNLRSVTSPKKIDLGRTASKQASQLSGLIAFGALVGSGAIAFGIFFVAHLFKADWILVPLFAAFAAAAFLVYRQSLRHIDTYALAHREELFSELCKQ